MQIFSFLPFFRMKFFAITTFRKKKRKRVSSSMNKLAARRLDEVTRAKLSRASCVTQIAKIFSFSFFSWLLVDLSIDSGFLVHYDFLFSLCLFGFCAGYLSRENRDRFAAFFSLSSLSLSSLRDFVAPWAVVLRLIDPFSLSFFFSLSLDCSCMQVLSRYSRYVSDPDWAKVLRSF